MEDPMIAVAEQPRQELRTERTVSAAMEPIRLLVVDDHPAVRRGLRELLDEEPDFRVVDTASSAKEGLAVAEHTAVDVAVVDYQLRGRNGLWLSRKLKRLHTAPRVLIYSAYSDGLLAAAAVVAEADGLVSKGGLGSDLTEAIRCVADGRTVLPMLSWGVAELMRERLDDQEQAIYGMLVAGIPAGEIGRTLGLSPAKLQSCLSEMMAKLESLDAARTIVRRYPEPSVVDSR
jgi:DNA-binding NarL/FixJ family response regulator